MEIGQKRASARLVDESVPAMVWAARPDLSCEYLSHEWLRFTGLAGEHALGDGWSRAVHPEDLARWLDACVRAFDAREVFQIDYRLRRHDGVFRWIRDRGAPRLSADGVFLGFAGVCVDIDECKRAERELARSLERERRLRTAAEESSQLRDGFLSTVLRDLQSPVQAIATWARHLREQVMPGSEAAAALEAMESNARAQDRILSDLLDLSRIANGGIPQPRATAERLLQGVRVLVVDDDASTRETLLRVLGIAGAEAKGAGSSAEALEALRGFRPDVLVSDVTMRNGAGFELIRAVRALPAERGGCLRAAALTTGERPGDTLSAVAAGYDAQLAKPVEPVSLLATIARLAQPVGA
jgi:PAS domain S-box-containing protein